METIEKFTLPKVTEDMFLTEAKSSVALTKEVANKINELVDAYNELNVTRYDVLNDHSASIRQAIVYMKDNLGNTINELFKKMNNNGEIQSILDSIFTSTHVDSLNVLKEQSINVKNFGARGDGVADDTIAIQNAINYATTNGRCIYLPSGTYLITSTIDIKGCTIIGSPVNYLGDSGTKIRCKTKDFIALRQADNSDLMSGFDIRNIMIYNARVGIEIIRGVHSIFEHIYINHCEIGLKLGNSTLSGSEYCEFRNIRVENCDTGILSYSGSKFNHNRFTNCYIDGSVYSATFEVVEDYTTSGLHNVFEGCVFKSATGRGVVVRKLRDVTFSNCLFECGANAFRNEVYSTINLVNCCFKGYIKGNRFEDTCILYCMTGFNLHIHHGSVYVNENHTNMYFYGTDTTSSHNNITVSKPFVVHGGVSTFKDFAQPVNRAQYVKE